MPGEHPAPKEQVRTFFNHSYSWLYSPGFWRHGYSGPAALRFGTSRGLMCDISRVQQHIQESSSLKIQLCRRNQRTPEELDLGQTGSHGFVPLFMSGFSVRVSFLRCSLLFPQHCSEDVFICPCLGLCLQEWGDKLGFMTSRRTMDQIGATVSELLMLLS